MRLGPCAPGDVCQTESGQKSMWGRAGKRQGVGGKGFEISFARPLRGSVWVGNVKETVSGARRSMGPTLPSGLCRLASGNGRRWGRAWALLPRATSDEGLRDVPFRAHMCLPNFLMMGGNSYRP